MPAHNRPNIRLPSPRTAKSRSRKTRVRRRWNRLLRHVSCWQGARSVRRRLTAAPRPVRIGARGARPRGILADKPRLSRCPQAERVALFPGGALDKEPIETWRRYEPFFHTHSTNAITPELLAALRRSKHRQSGGAHLLALAAHLESLRGVRARLERCGHVSDDRRSLRRSGTLLYPRERCRRYRVRVHWPLYPRGSSHAIDLAAVYLDHNVAAVLARAPDAAASPQQKQDLAAFIHLCGAGPASAFVHRGFQMMAGERCGDHLVAAYLAKVNAMKRQFLRLAECSAIRKCMGNTDQRRQIVAHQH